MNKFASYKINQIKQLQALEDIVVGLQRKYASELVAYDKGNHKKYAWGKALAAALGVAGLGGGLTWLSKRKTDKPNVEGLHPTANGGTSMDDTIKGISLPFKDPFDSKKFLSQSKSKPGLHQTDNGGTSIDDTIKDISLPFKEPFDSKSSLNSGSGSKARSARQQRVDARQKKVRDARSARQQKLRKVKVSKPESATPRMYDTSNIDASSIRILNNISNNYADDPEEQRRAIEDALTVLNRPKGHNRFSIDPKTKKLVASLP